MAKINKAALVERVYEYDNFETKKQATEFVEDFFGMIKDAVQAGDTVTVAKFGKFEPYTRKNGEIVPKFRAFDAFKSAVAS